MKRLKIRITGIVQGVGFRPFVYNLAEEKGISGFVGNDSDGVFVEAQGTDENLSEFVDALENSPPPLSQVDSVKAEEIASITFDGFHIEESVKGEKMDTLVSPDMAICKDCARELKDDFDRRYHYPFINCTNCGPRYSIIYDIPYDRPYTSMKKFELCPECRAEYENPGNRRFHAQPNACEECGPWVEVYDTDRRRLQNREYAVVLANQSLRRGAIMAIKGLGGFHLACNAHNELAVRELRQRKNREEKPLAVMVKDVETAKKYAHFSKDELALLTSPQAPIVLAKKREEISPNIAPGNPRIGIMLPYTPLHHLLFASTLDALVMTSGNYSEEPICIENNDAFNRLGDIADYTLVHNREILQRVDDSVVIMLADKPRFVRRSRGYVPRPINILHSTDPVLAVGGALKNTICYIKEDRAFPSQHIGDLSNTRAMDFFNHTREHLGKILEVEPNYVAYDLHPGCLATQWAKSYSDEQDLSAFGIQHHHAHMASVMVEHGLDDPVIGLIMDGTGYGTDGTIWGGEVLIGDYTKVNRFAHIENVPEPGGDKAVQEPWRMGLAYLWKTFGEDALSFTPYRWSGFPIPQVKQMLDKGINAPMTSSCGRLFDGIGAIAGGRTHMTFEGQAAIEFQHAMEKTEHPSLEYGIERCGEHYEFLIAPIVKSVLKSLGKKASYGEISYLFHEMLISMFLDIAEKARAEASLEKVALSGGVFQNSYLFERMITELNDNGFTVYAPEQVPTNDGGLSLGQAAIAQALVVAGKSEVELTYE
ncbi:MAG: carbamoyltransferase HypF [Candidatus Marinimicrobia bacterium]|nr:carbamoyltransferase HypF [Candidatus Neomarinimicrobiota bacterium]MCF7828466.1 carbamoyltransferase HypF [Candidatus Neomarinimicrobiota bacterium]MCF7880940.1 carbamoyltransferase HypF [Candidatus Neomarinimicrobiota bacterium]